MASVQLFQRVPACVERVPVCIFLSLADNPLNGETRWYKRINNPSLAQIELLLLQQEGLIAGYGASDQPPIPAEELL